ncbi:hypothetical protein [Nonomuraea sp. NPDC049141]|uniref:hypothetical protein n=1 Tax=Nonomuraea sp. NPDC049141 TaxID=3155500 RepID=UPI0033D099C1
MSEYSAPQPPTRDLCGTMLVHRKLLNESMTYRARRNVIENRALRYERERRAPVRTDAVTLPVVVHVVHNPKVPEQNISDEQVHSQITVLNQDFRAKNPDVGKVPQVWKPLVTDAQIEFQLATRDPNGEPTDGIIRVETDQPSFTWDDAVKASATGGADPWPSDQYLNLWVCQLGGRPPRLCAVPRRSAADRRRGHPPLRLRDHGHSDASLRWRPYRDARDWPLAEPLPHLGRR